MTTDKEDLEHVTRYLLNNKNTFKTKFVKVNLNPEFARNIRLTIDYPKDMEIANAIMETLPDKLNFKSNDILGSLYKNAICTGEK
jgi:spore coat polysaccharide biosynthesis protein SpsF (cytidylyltransferase family)